MPASGPSYSSNDLAGSTQDVLGLGNARAQQQLPQQQQQQPPQQLPQQQQYMPRGPPPGSSFVTNRSRHPGNPGGVAGGAGLVQYEWEGGLDAGVGLGVEEEEELELEHEHGELMESILEDEEEIIALHRQQIEDAMEVVRRYGGRAWGCELNSAFAMYLGACGVVAASLPCQPVNLMLGARLT